MEKAKARWNSVGKPLFSLGKREDCLLYTSAGADRETVCRLMQCINTTEAIEILREQGLLGQVMKTVTERIEFYLRQRAGEELRIGMILFSLEDGILGRTKAVSYTHLSL